RAWRLLGEVQGSGSRPTRDELVGRVGRETLQAGPESFTQVGSVELSSLVRLAGRNVGVGGFVRIQVSEPLVVRLRVAGAVVCQEPTHEDSPAVRLVLEAGVNTEDQVRGGRRFERR